MDMVRNMTSTCNLPESFWCEALKTTAYILNIVRSKCIPIIDEEKAYFEPFLYLGLSSKVKLYKSQFKPRSTRCYFVDYPDI